MNNQPKTRKRRLATYAALIMLSLVGTIGIASCTSDSDDMDQPSGGNTAIGFGFTSQATRGTSTETADLKKIGVFGYSHTNAWSAGNTAGNSPDYFLNKAVIKKNGTWEYDGVIKYWPSDRKVSFFAYAPYSDVEGTFDEVYPDRETDVASSPYIKYLLPTDVTKQIDLLYANKLDMTYATSNAGKVPFTMKHALTKIGFTAKRDAADANSWLTVKVTAIEYKYISGTGTLNLEDGIWDVTFPASGDNGRFPTFTLTPDKDGGLNPNTVEIKNTQTSTVQLNTNDGYFLFIPQQLSGRGTGIENTILNIYYDLVETTSGKIISEQEVKKYELKGFYEAGKSIVYNMTFNTSSNEVDLTLSQTIVDWVTGATMPNQPGGENSWW
ncbi:MAG: fimbrillin family protein [Bacteroides xylanisolvens]